MCKRTGSVPHPSDVLDGKLDDEAEPLLEAVVLWSAVGSGVFAVVLGLAGALRAQSWMGRYGGVLIALVGAFLVTGIVFL